MLFSLKIVIYMITSLYMLIYSKRRFGNDGGY